MTTASKIETAETAIPVMDLYPEKRRQTFTLGRDDFSDTRNQLTNLSNTLRCLRGDTYTCRRGGTLMICRLRCRHSYDLR